MTECIFCAPHRSEIFKEIILENEHSIVVADNFPVSPGHLLVMPKQHFDDWFKAPLEIQSSVSSLLIKAHDWLQAAYKPDGFNLGTNCGVAAGQSVFHLHYHVIPRYAGDHEKPAGGVRHVLKSDYPG